MVNWYNYFQDPSYLPWFWLLVGLLIIYLIKPKPINQTIPSLMFLMQDKGKAIRNSFFRYLFRDFVLLLQLLILALLVAAAAQPYIELSKESLVGSSVIVLDASASMNADDGRWNEAKSLASQSLSRQNTIILVKNRPEIIAREVSRSEAESLLRSLNPSATETNLYAALVAAREFTIGADTVVTVISDFRNTDLQQDYGAAAKTLMATGAVVELKAVGTQMQNIGIISMVVEEQRTRIGVRNYGEQSVVATIKVGNFEQAMPLGPGATDYVTIQTPAGINEVTLEPRDDFMLDNKAFISNSDDFNLRVLLVTNDANIQRTPLWYALESIDGQTPLSLDIELSNPPNIPSINHDIVIFSGVDSSLLVQRTVREALQAAQSGTGVIIMSQTNLFSINYEGLLPLTSDGKGGGAGVSSGEFSSFTRDVDFGDVQEYHRITATGNALGGSGGFGRVIAVTSNDETPLITLFTQGQGQVLYYGIDDSKSSFPLEPTYPVFWKRVLDQLTGRISIERLNALGGDTPVGVIGTPETPSGDPFTGFYDEAGLYKYDDRTVAVNLLSSEESDVAAVQPDLSLSQAAQALAGDKKQLELAAMMAVTALILLFLELFIVKFRGDF